MLNPCLSDDEQSAVQELVQKLLPYADLDNKQRALLRPTAYRVRCISKGKQKEHRLSSWKVAEHAYRSEKLDIPTKARGLFTEQIESDEPGRPRASTSQHRIVLRGYDKFFNVGELPSTKWDNLPEYAGAPFYLTLKSNGCIIFISALDQDSLIVSSKHAIDDSDAKVEKSHARAGDRWLDKTLAKVGKTRPELASRLWSSNLTAIAELCDDDFEEHVLPYPPDKTGLHLHGLNHNLAHLRTLPPEAVRDFATEWGFIPTPFIVLQSLSEVKAFTDKAAETGRWEGELVEGFVIRGQALKPVELPESHRELVTFMWKVKFDHPYLMWRDWREKTRQIIKKREVLLLDSGKSPEQIKQDSRGVINIAKIKEPETRLYVHWTLDMLDDHPDWFKHYAEGRGIIAVRQRFLDWRASADGRKAQEPTTAKGNAHKTASGDALVKTIIAPIAVQGSGKTSLGVALSELYGWAHVQSDNAPGKKSASYYQTSIADALRTNDVVYADRNNHLKQHREEIVSVARRLETHFHVNIITVLWNIEQLPRNEVYRLCADRIVERGDRHQTLRAQEDSAHEHILWRMMASYEPFDPVLNPADGPGEVINIDLRNDLSDMLDHAIGSLQPLLQLERPSPERVEHALKSARSYRPELRKEMNVTGLAATAYYGLLCEVDLKAFLEATPGVDQAMVAAIVAGTGITIKPHVTIVHRREIDKARPDQEEKQRLWNVCKSLASSGDPTQNAFTITLGPRVIWDERVMVIQVEHVQPLDKLGLTSFKTSHITVGQISREIAPDEGRQLAAASLAKQQTTVQGGQINSVAITAHDVRASLRALSINVKAK
ncbi:uncharacterized protein L969DRAFT_84766 [Mixia osmundae IAM 14324]|uniref:tRNA ligase n=1 Tax=Mixia osmundae (strain CBS 9802 / IAM 14324 / JCM 22182 / KY 12970) TaxID=764103 RepID=G7DTE2_MIXOS|nr:uncharacterized protein L969DRAFT_84766 [Mixia osmundae IAM 14324]KEI42873.1 hypothetical protein L969DRAFT_84766 [Mixia osmundae IAM 14324]GAA93789.1 hypothetical protein E5Q_00435 [Mixia osmundae IAM 14324]